MFNLWKRLMRLPVDEALCYGLGAFVGGLVAALVLCLNGVENNLWFALFIGFSCLVATVYRKKHTSVHLAALFGLLLGAISNPSLFAAWWIVAIVCLCAELGRVILTPASQSNFNREKSHEH